MKTASDTSRPLRVAAYARVSTSNQVLAFDSSIDTQLQLIRAKAQFESEQARVSADRRQWNIVAEYREEGRSAKNTDRPELKRLMADVQAGKIDIVCVTKIDRITRSLIDFYELWGSFEKHHIEFVALSDNFETRTATGKAMLKITLVFAELERERTSERTKEKIQARRQQGMWFGGRVPLGYGIDPSNKTTLIVDEPAAKLVRRDFFQRFLKLKSVRALTRDLNQRGIQRPKTKNKRGEATGGGLFTVPGVARVLSNRAYIAKREIAGGAQLDCVWKPIIEPELFERVQQLLRSNSVRRPSGRPSPAYTFVLEGVLRCGACGAALTHASANGSGGTYFYYRCTRKKHTAGGACKARDVPADAVERFVIAQLKALAVDGKTVKAAVARANSGRSVELRNLDAELKERRAAEQEQSRVLNKLLATFEGADGPPPATLRKRMLERESVQQELRDQIANLEAKRHDLTRQMLDADVVAEGLAQLPRLLERAEKKNDREGLKSLLGTTVQTIVWRHDPDDPKKGDAEVHLFELGPDFWAAVDPGKGKPDEPSSSSSGRHEWLPE